MAQVGAYKGGEIMSEIEAKIDQNFRRYAYDKMCFEAERTYDKFCEEHAEKEFEELEITKEEYTIDNLLDIVDKLQERIEGLVNDYNNLLTDSAIALEDIVYSLPDYEEI